MPSRTEALQSALGNEAQQQALTAEEAGFVAALDVKLQNLVSVQHAAQVDTLKQKHAPECPAPTRTACTCSREEMRAW
mgnify:CR=1 FL=1